MVYSFKTKEVFVKFLSNLREVAIGEQSTIYFDDKNEKAIKIFTINNKNDYLTIRKKVAKIKELAKYRSRFPNAALPEEIIKCERRCCGYTMPILKDCVSLKEFRLKARKHTIDREEILKIACNLAELVEDLHKEGIVIGDFHPNQFMTKNGKVFACDTDTWGITNRGRAFEADKVGKAGYIDPEERDFNANGVVVKEYTQETDYFSLAVVVFEILVGFNPFNGIYPLVKGYNQTLKALNGISIIGNHNLKKIEGFNMEHVAWMSEELQRDFLKIFEGGERFNILPALKNMENDLKKCKKGHCYNSARYPKCPICKNSHENALEVFRTCSVNSISYGKFAIFPEKEVRKVINFSTYFDYDKKAISVERKNTKIEKKINSRAEEVYFVGNELTITVESISRIKQFFYTLFGKFDFLYGKSSFKEKMKKWSDANNSVCKLEIRHKDGKKLYSDIIFNQTSKLKICGYHLFYVNVKNELIKVDMTVNACPTNIVYKDDHTFLYEVNRNGDYCICNGSKTGYLHITVNGQEMKKLEGYLPKIIRYDDKGRGWCIITQKINSKEFGCYVINNRDNVLKEFEWFSLGTLSLKNCIFYDWMLIIPSDKKILFLKSGKTLETSTVSQIDVGVVSKDSKLTIKENNKKGRKYLFIQNSTQVYKIRMS